MHASLQDGEEQTPIALEGASPASMQAFEERENEVCELMEEIAEYRDDSDEGGEAGQSDADGSTKVGQSAVLKKPSGIGYVHVIIRQNSPRVRKEILQTTERSDLQIVQHADMQCHPQVPKVGIKHDPESPTLPDYHRKDSVPWQGGPLPKG